jgi:hydrophobe/amphiphile efflux-1 (HAE1) family protein
MQRLKRSFPPGLDYKIIYNPTDFVRASITEVEKSLFIALCLVVVVVVIFLQSWRAAIIPIIAIPVSLVGTFAVLSALGFSLNNLSLFALVLAIGIVVDDAIVVVENIERHLRTGMSPREAAHLTMDEVGGALIAIALVLIAVFVPTAFLTGISGQFYRQFALTIASATVISLTLSLTLSPAMAALIMRDEGLHGGALTSWRHPVRRFGQMFNRGFDRLSELYSRTIHRLVNLTVIVLVIYGGLLAVTAWRLSATPQGFIPAQDQGNLLISATLPPGSALARTDAVMKDIMARLLATPGVVAGSVYSGVDATTGTTSSNNGQIYVILQPFAERLKRGLTLKKIQNDIQRRVAAIDVADIRVLQPPPVRGIGTTGGFKMIIEDQVNSDPAPLVAAANRVAEAANRSPAVDHAFVTFNAKSPALFADIDRTKAEMLGVKDSAVFDTLQTYLGSSFVNQFNLFGKTFDVYAQADAPSRTDESKIAGLKTRSASGAMVPLGSVLTLRHITEPYRVLRYNIYSGAEIQGDTKLGFSTGQAMTAMEQAAEKNLPPGFSYEWTELAYQQKLAGNTGIYVFGASVVFVFLMLAALYESVTLPFAVILIVPMCLLAAMIGVNLRGQDNNILTQVGLVVLIGLAAKNAILIVEFARQGEEDQGLERHEAAAEAGRTRLRPILMTSFAFIFGVMPLAFASGAGAEMRQALGTAVFAGMIGVTAFGLIFTPVFYVVCRILSERIPRAPRPPRAATAPAGPSPPGPPT